MSIAFTICTKKRAKRAVSNHPKFYFNEVDFIVYGKDTFLAIEVKNIATIRPQDLRSLKAFGQDYPEAERILLYRGQERLLRDGITIKPCEEFLRELV